MTDIFKRISERRGWVVDDSMPPEVLAEKETEKRVWASTMRQMHEPFKILSEAIDQGLEHAAIRLEIIPRPKSQPSKDVEAQAGKLLPGDTGFCQLIDDKIQAFNSRRGELLRAWVTEREAALQEERIDNPEYKYSAARLERDQVQFYVLLFMENLMHTAGIAVRDLATFADSKVEDGTMKRSRLILPGFRRLKKWFIGVISNEDSSAEQSPDLMEGTTNIIYFGDGYNRKKDPEHLPPVTGWQHFSQGLRALSKFFGSEESAFGLRAACATMTIGIIAFLESTQRFFIEQRLVWAMIMVAIGMTMSKFNSSSLGVPKLTLRSRRSVLLWVSLQNWRDRHRHVHIAHYLVHRERTHRWHNRLHMALHLHRHVLLHKVSKIYSRDNDHGCHPNSHRSIRTPGHKDWQRGVGKGWPTILPVSIASHLAMPSSSRTNSTVQSVPTSSLSSRLRGWRQSCRLPMDHLPIASDRPHLVAPRLISNTLSRSQLLQHY